MTVHDRILELRRVPASSLRPSERNWRTHPPAQRAALEAILDEVGFASALLTRQLPDGMLEIIDGHLRADITPDGVVPVLVLDVNKEEAAKLLALVDPLAALAEADVQRLRDLVTSIHWQSSELREVSDALLKQHETAQAPSATDEQEALPESFQLVIDCESEREQQELFERLTSEGLACRVITL